MKEKKRKIKKKRCVQCNRELCEVSGCKWKGCGISSSVKVEGLDDQPQIVGRENKEEEEQ